MTNMCPNNMKIWLTCTWSWSYLILLSALVLSENTLILLLVSGWLLSRLLSSGLLLHLLGLLLLIVLASVGFIVQILNKFINLLLRLLFCTLLLEVQNNIIALGDVLVCEEVVKERLQLSHAVVEELVWSVTESLLGWEVWETVVSFQVKLLLNKWLEISHWWVPVPDVENNIARSYHLDKIGCVPILDFVLYKLHFISLSWIGALYHIS